MIWLALVLEQLLEGQLAGVRNESDAAAAGETADGTADRCESKTLQQQL